MRTPESRIKEAILHPEEEVRLTAVSYFSRSHGRDETVMPLVIEAVEKYGRDHAFRTLRDADALPQTEATVGWLAGELSKDWDLADVTNDNYCFAVALILCNGRIDLLRPDLVDLPRFPEELRDWLLERLEMATWDWHTGWAVLEQLGRDVRDQGQFRVSDYHRGRRIVESLARHRNRADVILSLLQRRYRGYERNLMEWLESHIAEVAGKMRSEEAVPLLVERLHEDDFNLSNSCLTALIEIGGDRVVRTLAEHWREGEDDFRHGAAEILGNIHTDFSVEKSLEFFAGEEEEVTNDFLANALLGNFVPEAVESIRQMVLGDDVDPDEEDLKTHLIAACTVMGTSFPEYDEWYNKAVKDGWGWRGYERKRIREHFVDSDEETDLDDDEWDDEEGLDEDHDGDGFDEDRYALRPFRREDPRVGRNDPCPCGSGKKYKKCCGSK